MKIQKLADLEEKIGQIIKQHNTIKRDKEKIESRLAYKNKESEEVRKQLEQMLKQKEVIRQKLDSIIEKLQTLTIR